MLKTDLLKAFKPYYSARLKPGHKLTEPGEFLSIMGHASSTGADFTERMRALRATALELRKLSRAGGVDFAVPRLEVLWESSHARRLTASSAGVSQAVAVGDRGYCLMLRMPGFVTKAMVDLATRQVRAEGLALAAEVELHARLAERVVQVLHRGSALQKPLSLERLDIFMRENCLVQDGPCHEIYLSDPGDDVSAMRIIIRLPVRKQGAGGIRLR
jgi:hypothetical protein